MRIALDARYLSKEFSGIGNYCEYLVRNLVPADPENHYSIFVHQSFDRDLDLPQNAEVIPAPARPVSFYTLLRMGRAVRETKAGIFHSLFPITPLFLNIPMAVTVHDLQALTVPEFTGQRASLIRRAYDVFYRWTYPRSIRSARFLITDSHATRREMAAAIPESRANTIVIYPGLDQTFGEPVDEIAVRQVAEKYQLPASYVLYLGSTRPNKNLPNMIRAFHSMRESRGDLHDLHFVLVVSADRFFEESRRVIKELRLQKRMRVYGQISELEKRCFYDRSSGLFLATKYEGFGIPLLEAQACGVPVLAANHASLPEIANGSALLADPDDVEDIAEKLYRLLTDADLRATLISAGKENAKRFDWARTAQAIRDMYHHLF